MSYKTLFNTQFLDRMLGSFDSIWCFFQTNDGLQCWSKGSFGSIKVFLQRYRALLVACGVFAFCQKILFAEILASFEKM